jgi:hypothetical protein
MKIVCSAESDGTAVADRLEDACILELVDACERLARRTLDGRERAFISDGLRALTEAGDGEAVLVHDLERTLQIRFSAAARRRLARTVVRSLGAKTCLAAARPASATAVRGAPSAGQALPPVTDAGVARVTVLDEPSSDAWVLQVLAVSRFWRTRALQAPFFSLGLAAYLDIHAGRCAYRDRAQRRENNQLLLTHFRPLLEAVSDAVSEYVAAAVRLAHDEAALPGFHIYLPDPAFARPVASVHRDLQYRDVFPGSQAAHTFSFTLPLSTPPGSGLNVWSEDGSEITFHRYRTGEMVIHDGLRTHQAVLDCAGESERITLQGHGIRKDGHAVLYW